MKNRQKYKGEQDGLKNKIQKWIQRLKNSYVLREFLPLAALGVVLIISGALHATFPNQKFFLGLLNYFIVFSTVSLIYCTSYYLHMYSMQNTRYLSKKSTIYFSALILMLVIIWVRYSLPELIEDQL